MSKLFLVAVDSAGFSSVVIRACYGRCLDTRAQNCMNTTYLDVDVVRNVVQSRLRGDPQVRGGDL